MKKGENINKHLRANELAKHLAKKAESICETNKGFFLWVVIKL